MPQTAQPKPSHECASPSQQLDNSGIFCIDKSRRARSPVTIAAPKTGFADTSSLSVICGCRTSPFGNSAVRRGVPRRWLPIIDAVVNRDFCTACGFAVSRECKCLSANEGFDVDDDL